MTYELPTALDISGTEYHVRSDFRVMLDCIIALNDPELDDNDVGIVLLTAFYPDFGVMPPDHYGEAIKQCFWFMNCGDESKGKNSPKLMDWEQDFSLIVSPINRLLGQEVRAVEYMHWWTFISLYREIGDCLFSQVVSIREKIAKGKALDKSEREFYRKNRDIIDFKNTYTEAEDDLLKAWGAR